MNKLNQLSEYQKKRVLKGFSVASFIIGLFSCGMTSLFQNSLFGYIFGFILVIIGLISGIISMKGTWILSVLGVILNLLFSILLIAGITTTQFTNLDSYKKDVSSIMQKTDFSYPLNYKLEYINTFKRTDSDSKIYKYTITYTDKNELSYLTKNLEESEHFTKISSNSYQKVLPENYQDIWSASLYSCLYFEQTNRFFEIPTEEGEYTCWLIQMDGKKNMVIYRFEYFVKL